MYLLHIKSVQRKRDGLLMAVEITRNGLKGHSSIDPTDTLQVSILCLLGQNGHKLTLANNFTHQKLFKGKQ